MLPVDWVKSLFAVKVISIGFLNIAVGLLLRFTKYGQERLSFTCRNMPKIIPVVVLPCMLRPAMWLSFLHIGLMRLLVLILINLLLSERGAIGSMVSSMMACVAIRELLGSRFLMMQERSNGRRILVISPRNLFVNLRPNTRNWVL